MALTDKKAVPEAEADQTIATHIRARLEGGRLPCAAACALAAELDRPTAEVGRTADALRVPLTACQLGLFGYPGHAKGWEQAGVAAQPAPPGLEEQLRASVDEQGALTCLSVWRAAQDTGCSRIHAGAVADRLGLKIRDCQLGAL